MPPSSPAASADANKSPTDSSPDSAVDVTAGQLVGASGPGPLKHPGKAVRVTLDRFWSRIVEIAALSQILGVLIALAVLIYSVVPGDKVSFYQYRQDQAERRMSEANFQANSAEARAHEAEQRATEARAHELKATQDANDAARKLAMAAEREQAADALRSSAELRTSQALASATANERNAKEIEKRARAAATALQKTNDVLRVAESERDRAATESRQIKDSYTAYVVLNVFELAERACAGDDLYKLASGEPLSKAGEQLSDCMQAVTRWKADGRGDATIFYRDGLLVKGRGAPATALGAPLSLIKPALASFDSLADDDRLALTKAIVTIREAANQEAQKAVVSASLGDIVERAGATIATGTPASK